MFLVRLFEKFRFILKESFHRLARGDEDALSTVCQLIDSAIKSNSISSRSIEYIFKNLFAVWIGNVWILWLKLGRVLLIFLGVRRCWLYFLDDSIENRFVSLFLRSVFVLHRRRRCTLMCSDLFSFIFSMHFNNLIFNYRLLSVIGRTIWLFSIRAFLQIWFLSVVLEKYDCSLASAHQQQIDHRLCNLCSKLLIAIN